MKCDLDAETVSAHDENGCAAFGCDAMWSALSICSGVAERTGARETETETSPSDCLPVRARVCVLLAALCALSVLL